MKTVLSGNEKSKIMADALAGFKKSFGDVMVCGNRSQEELREALMKVDVVSTGSLSLDSALGVWGFPRGRIIELYGAEHSGKTSIALHCIGCCQRMGGNALFIDVEHALDPLFAMKNTANFASMYYIRPNSGTEAMNMLLYWLQKNKENGTPLMDVIVVDSVAALVTEGQLEEDIGKAEVAVGARLLAQTLRNITPFIDGAVVIFINQMRDKPGVMFGDHETTPGGRAMKYYSSVRCKVSKRGGVFLTPDGSYATYEDKDKKKIREVGRRVKIEVEKNKVAPKGFNAEFDYVEGVGILRYRELAMVGIEQKVIDAAGAYYTLPGGERIHGFDNLITTIRDGMDKYELPILQGIQKKIVDARRQEVDKLIANVSSRPDTFQMWQAAAQSGKVDLMDTDDKPPTDATVVPAEVTATDVGTVSTESAEKVDASVSFRRRK